MAPSIITNAGTVKSTQRGEYMRIINIIENTPGSNDCMIGHGLSFYIETAKHKLLMDTGPSGDIIENCEKLGVSLSNVDTVILSHGHYDHAGGIMPFANINSTAKIYMHREAAGNYYAFDGKEKGYRYIGIDPEITQLDQIVYVSGNMKIDETLSVFCEITGKRNLPDTNKRLLKNDSGRYIQDSFAHEQCLVIEEQGKHFLFSGCAHNGILNILDRYEELYDAQPDVAVSGFHMMKKTDYTSEDIRNIRNTAYELTQYPTVFYTCHCTGIPAYQMMKEIMGEQLHYVHCGEEISVPRPLI